MMSLFKLVTKSRGESFSKFLLLVTDRSAESHYGESFGPVKVPSNSIKFS